jgi:hypothetical protein
VTHADLVLRSLEEVPLAELVRRVEREKEQAAAR